MKSSVLLVVLLVCAVGLTSAKPDRYQRAIANPSVCNKGDFLRASRCWRPCPKGHSQSWNSWAVCQKNCNAGERSVKGRCYTKKCIRGWRRAGGKCWLQACPRGWVAKSVTECWRPCPRPYKPRGHKCVNTGARPGQCDSYTRPSTKRASRPFIVYTQRRVNRSWYWPRCRPGWDMFPGRKCRGPCKKGYRKVGPWCKNNICFTNKHKYKRGGPNHPTVCPKNSVLKNRRCWHNCPRGYVRQWNNWFRCQGLCRKGHRSIRGVCYTRDCPKGWRGAGGKCWLQACPRGWVPKSVTECWRPCPRPYKPRGHKCVNTGARPGQCDSYTRPSTKRASRPFITYRLHTKPKKNTYPGCPGGWVMIRGMCRKKCRPGFTVVGNDCKMTKCIGI